MVGVPGVPSVPGPDEYPDEHIEFITSPDASRPKLSDSSPRPGGYPLPPVPQRQTVDKTGIPDAFRQSDPEQRISPQPPGQGIGPSLPDQGTRDYDRPGAEQDRERLNKRLDGLSETLGELRGKSDDLDSRVDEIQRDINDLKTMVNDLVGSRGGQSPGATFQPVAQLSVIEDDALSVAEDNDSAPQGFFKKLRRMFRGIWAMLWRLLSRFRMVKEWSLSGELGPVPFMGKVGVSVTFGR
jgi:hypothetical protein